MDLDASLKKHGSRLDEIESFVDHIKGLMSGADEGVARASDQLDGLLAFKSRVEAMLPMLEKAVGDVSLVAADLAAIKKDLEPALAWIAERQKADAAAVSAAPEKPPVAPERADSDRAAAGAQEAPQGEPAARSESEQPAV